MNSNIIVYLLEMLWLYHIIKSIATKDHWEYGCGKEIVSVISVINVVALTFVGICFVVRCL
jgi:ethanolamine transporter EutH